MTSFWLCSRIFTKMTPDDTHAHICTHVHKHKMKCLLHWPTFHTQKRQTDACYLMKKKIAIKWTVFSMFICKRICCQVKKKNSMEIPKAFKVLSKLSATHQMNGFRKIVCLFFCVHKYMWSTILSYANKSTRTKWFFSIFSSCKWKTISCLPSFVLQNGGFLSKIFQTPVQTSFKFIINVHIFFSH